VKGFLGLKEESIELNFVYYHWNSDNVDGNEAKQTPATSLLVVNTDEFFSVVAIGVTS
jgi:hypothetical protein